MNELWRAAFDSMTRQADMRSVVVKSVPSGATVVGVPGRIVESLPSETRVELDFEHGNLPDPLSDLMKMLLQLHSRLEDRIKRLENQAEKKD